MDLLSTQWMIGLLGFAGGIAFGALIYHFTRSDTTAQSAMSGKVKELENKQAVYQDEVAEHFARTAELVNRLTESYRDVHTHLASGAQSLCGDNEALRLQLESSLANRLIITEEPETAEEPDNTKGSSHVEPPRDYAPKSDPKDRGTLSATYGLAKDKVKEKDPTKNKKKES